VNISTLLGGFLGQGASAIAGSAFDSIANDFGKSAAQLATWCWAEIGTATTVGFSGAPFLKLLGITLAIAITVGLALFIIQIITSVLRRDPAGLARAGRGLLIAFLGGAASIGVVNILLVATDALSAGVVKVATGDTVASLGKAILGTVTIGSGLLGPVTAILISLLIIGAIVMIWFAMTIRKLLIIIAAVFAPIAFAGALADVTTGWVKKWVEGMLALVFSKLILVIILITGYFALVKGVGTPVNSTYQAAAAAGATHPTVALTQLAVGGLILMMAAFSPWIALKTVHFAGDHMAQVHAHAQSATAGAQTAVAAPQKIGGVASSAAGAVGGAGASMKAPGAAGAAGAPGGADGPAGAPSDGPTGAPGAAADGAGASGTASAASGASGAASGAGAAGASGASGAGAAGAAAGPVGAAAGAGASAASAAKQGVERNVATATDATAPRPEAATPASTPPSTPAATPPSRTETAAPATAPRPETAASAASPPVTPTATPTATPPPAKPI